MGKLDKYLDKARDLAEDAGDKAKDVVSRAKKLADEGGAVRDLTQSAREQTSALAIGAKEKVQGVLQDAKAGKEIRQGITELENLPEYEGSIIYKMELDAMINSLKSLLLIINDNRLDDASVAEEIRKVMSKVQPSAEPQTGEIMQQEPDEQHAIEKVKVIVYSACTRALAALNASAF